MKMKLVNLSSVGTVLDTETGDTYPMDLDGMPVIDEGVTVNLNDIDEEWAEALSTDDLNTVLDIYSTLPPSIDYV